MLVPSTDTNDTMSAGLPAEVVGQRKITGIARSRPALRRSFAAQLEPALEHHPDKLGDTASTVRTPSMSRRGVGQDRIL